MAGKDPFGVGAGRNPFGTQNANPFGTKTGPSTSVAHPKPDVIGDVGHGPEASHTAAISPASDTEQLALPKTDVIGDRGKGDEATPNTEIGPSGAASSHGGQLNADTPTPGTNTQDEDA
jgi:hypothetical protein